MFHPQLFFILLYTNWHTLHNIKTHSNLYLQWFINKVLLLYYFHKKQMLIYLEYSYPGPRSLYVEN